MTRHILDRDQVAHAWAHQTQDNARVASGNLYFTGPTLYSYGSHFVCGHHMPETYGPHIVAMNAGRYSNTTGRHMDAMHRALPGYFRTIEVPGLDQNMVYNIGRYGANDIGAALIDAGHAEMKKALTARRIRHDTRRAHLESARRFFDDARDLVAVDRKNRGISQDARDKARKLAKGLPDAVAIDTAISAVPDLEPARAIYQRIAGRKIRAEVKDAVTAFLRLADRVYLPDDAPGPLQYRNAASTAGSAARVFFTRVTSAYRAAGKDVPEHMRERAALLQRNAEEWTRASIAAERENDLAAFDRNMTAAESLTPENAPDMHQQRMRAAANLLNRLAYESGATERNARYQAERERALSRRRAVAAERAADALATAETSNDLETVRDAITAAHEWLRDMEAGPARGALLTREDAAADRLNDMERAARAETVEKWRRGELRQMPFNAREENARLRLSSDRATIETDQGADVPASVAPALWRLVKACNRRGNGQTFPHGAGPRLGFFRLDSIDAAGNIRAGCHRIAFDELCRMARTLGLEDY